METTKNFNSNSPTQIIGEESLTSPVNTFGISPKYNLDGETQKVGIWELKVVQVTYQSLFSFDSNERKISWEKLIAGIYNLTLSWTPIATNGSDTIHKEITLTVVDDGNTPVPEGTELVSSANIPWDRLYHEASDDFNYYPNFLIPNDKDYDDIDHLPLSDYSVNDLFPSFKFLILSTNPELMRLSDNGGNYYHQRFYIGSTDDNDLKNICTLEFQINPLPNTSINTWYHIFATKNSGYTKINIFENSVWNPTFFTNDKTYTILDLSSLFGESNKIRDISTSGSCEVSFDKNNPAPSNNLFSFLRPIKNERLSGTSEQHIFVNGKDKTNDPNFAISDFKFGIKKNAIMVGYEYNFLFTMKYKGKEFYKMIKVEGNALYEVDGYKNSTNYYIDVEKTPNNSLTINPTNSRALFPNDAIFLLNPMNEQADGDKNLFSLVYKTNENKETVAEISWNGLTNTTPNNKVWTFEFAIKPPFSSKLFKILFNFFLLPISVTTADGLVDGEETDGNQFIVLNPRGQTKVNNQNFTVNTSISGIKFVSSLNDGVENQTDSTGKIYLQGKTNYSNTDTLSFPIIITINNFVLETIYTVVPGKYKTLPITEKFYKMSSIKNGTSDAKQIMGWSDEFVEVLEKTDNEIENYLKSNGGDEFVEYKIGWYLEINLSNCFMAWNADFKQPSVWNKLNIYKLNLNGSKWICWNASNSTFYSGYKTFHGLTSDTLREIDLGNSCFFVPVVNLADNTLVLGDGTTWKPYMNYQWKEGTDERVAPSTISYYTAYSTFEDCAFRNLKKLSLRDASFFIKTPSGNGDVRVELNSSISLYYYNSIIQIYSAYYTFSLSTFGSEKCHTIFDFKEMNMFMWADNVNNKVTFNIFAGSSLNDSTIRKFSIDAGYCMFWETTIYADELMFDNIHFMPQIEFVNLTFYPKLIFNKSGISSCAYIFDSAEIHTSKISFINCEFFHDFKGINYEINGQHLTTNISILDYAFYSAKIYGVKEISIDSSNSLTNENEKIDFYGYMEMSLFTRGFDSAQNSGSEIRKIVFECKLNVNLWDASEGAYKDKERTLDIFTNTFSSSFDPKTECNIYVSFDTKETNIDPNLELDGHIFIYSNTFGSFTGEENHIILSGTWTKKVAEIANEGSEYGGFGITSAKSIDISKLVFATQDFTSVKTYNYLFTAIEQKSLSGVYVYLPTVSTTPTQDFSKFKLGTGCFSNAKESTYVFVGYESCPDWMMHTPGNSQFYVYSL